MAVHKVYTIEHHAAIAASRREVREVTNRVKRAESVAPARGSAAKRKAKVKAEAPAPAQEAE